MADREKLIDVFMHIGDHVRSLDEYGLCFDSTLAKAIEDVVAMLKNQDANGVTLDNQVSSSKWIPVTEQEEPTENGTYLCHGYWFGSRRKQTETADFFGEWNIANNFILTHWMPLPQPPKGE